ncbi:EAL domain-containing protein, partial [Serratia marcescens]|uniref:EAL domain-containing protein n=1 Tax=Serratia marcescens TaxID=615 RepID=UPI0011E728EE
WTSEGEMVEEQSFRRGLADEELIHALDRRIYQAFFQRWAHLVAARGISVTLPLSTAGLTGPVLINEILDGLQTSGMPARLLHLVFSAESLMHTGVQEGLNSLRQAGCKIIISQVGQDLALFEHLTPGGADYLMLDPEIIGNVHTNLM